MLENVIRDLSCTAGDAIDGFMRDVSFAAQYTKCKIFSAARKWNKSRLMIAASYLQEEGKYWKAVDVYSRLFSMDEDVESKACCLSHEIHALVRGGEKEMNLAAEAYKAGAAATVAEHTHDARLYLESATSKAGLGLRMLKRKGIDNRALEMEFNERGAYAEALKMSKPAEFSTNQDYGADEYANSAGFYRLLPTEASEQGQELRLSNIVYLLRKMPQPEAALVSGAGKCV